MFCARLALKSGGGNAIIMLCIPLNSPIISDDPKTSIHPIGHVYPQA